MGEIGPSSRLRRRKEAESGLPEGGAEPYRIHFSCEHKGRYFRTSKRRIRWSFGFTNQLLCCDGIAGNSLRGEEHEITLIWSLKSGKTRIFWNKCDISRLFGDCPSGSDRVNIKWQTRTGDLLEITVHALAASGIENQYDLTVNGKSFFDFPPLEGIATEPTDETDHDIVSATSSLTLSNIGSVPAASTEGCPPEARDYRLSMAGLKQSQNRSGLTDELHSEVFSSSLDNVRSEIIECLPQLENMVSRAMLDAFISGEDLYSRCSSSSSPESPFETDLSQVEVSALWDAFEFSTSKSSHQRYGDDDDEALEIMRKQINSTFRRMRSGEMPSHIATRILLSVAALLGFEFNRPIPTDTVILYNLCSSTTVEEIKSVLSSYGYIENAAFLGVNDQGFGFCRFLEESAPSQVSDASLRDCIQICGATTKAVVLSEKSFHHISMRLSKGSQDECREDCCSGRRQDNRIERPIEKEGPGDKGSTVSPTSAMTPVFSGPDKLPDKLFPSLLEKSYDCHADEDCASFDSVIRA